MRGVQCSFDQIERLEMLFELRHFHNIQYNFILLIPYSPPLNDIVLPIVVPLHLGYVLVFVVNLCRRLHSGIFSLDRGVPIAVGKLFPLLGVLLVVCFLKVL